MQGIIKVIFAVLFVVFRFGIGTARVPKNARMVRLMQAVKSDLMPNKTRKKAFVKRGKK